MLNDTVRLYLHFCIAKSFYFVLNTMPILSGIAFSQAQNVIFVDIFIDISLFALKKHFLTSANAPYSMRKCITVPGVWHVLV